MTDENREEGMMTAGQTQAEALKELLRDFHGNGLFPWQFSSEIHKTGEVPDRRLSVRKG